MGIIKVLKRFELTIWVAPQNYYGIINTGVILHVYLAEVSGDLWVTYDPKIDFECDF